jgi:CDP-paratose 2-epimerase
LARRHNSFVRFLSTSRVYPIAQLNALEFEETNTRFELPPHQSPSGASVAGIAERFPLEGARTLYCVSTKLSAGFLIEEYRDVYGLRAIINRCGVIAGPWQIGMVDQGVFTYWILAHHFRRPLRYIGFGGKGKHVRDLLHVDDLLALLDEQRCDPAHWDDVTMNVGGGRDCSLSLLETTQVCAEITGNEVQVGNSGETRPCGVPMVLRACLRTPRARLAAADLCGCCVLGARL